MSEKVKCGRKSVWAADKVDYLRKLITSEGSSRKTYQKAERHLGGRFSVEQILLKCKALRAKDRKNPKSSAPLNLPDLSDLEFPLPAVEVRTTVKKILKKYLYKKEEREGFLSPRTSCPKTINTYVRRLIKLICEKEEKASVLN